jgi:type II secretory pathway pseudopilin PulG
MKQMKPTISRLPVRRARQEGATLVESIAYLGIAALVVLGAVSLLTGAFGNAKSNQTTEELIALRTGMRKLYMGQVAPADPVPDLISANVAPATLARSSDSKSLLNSWNGTVAIAVSGGEFTITYPNVPKDVCTDTVSTFPATLANSKTICKDSTNKLVFKAT